GTGSTRSSLTSAGPRRQPEAPSAKSTSPLATIGRLMPSLSHRARSVVARLRGTALEKVGRVVNQLSGTTASPSISPRATERSDEPGSHPWVCQEHEPSLLGSRPIRACAAALPTSIARRLPPSLPRNQLVALGALGKRIDAALRGFLRQFEQV